MPNPNAIIKSISTEYEIPTILSHPLCFLYHTTSMGKRKHILNHLLSRYNVKTQKLDSPTLYSVNPYRILPYIFHHK